MTVLQRLQDAITKLEQVRAGSTPGDWDILDGGDRFIAWHEDPESTGFEYIVSEPVEFERQPDADLIVTLHTMLPAVLDWMRDQLARMERDEFAVTDESRAIHYRHVLAVADAILDGEQ